jgi:hypothetical protein
MSMEYAMKQDPGILGQRVQPTPELGRIKHAVERVAKVRSNVECFLERFNGGGPDCAGGGTDERVSGYRNDLASLFEQIERLETVVQQLDSIG